MATPWLRRLLAALAWSAVTLYFALGLLVLVLRHVVLPGVEGYRDDIERNLGQALGRPVAIRAIDAHWRALWPNLRIHGLEIRDAEGRPALAFDEVEADIAWSSLWHLTPHFARLEIKAPRLDLRRDEAGRLFVAGLEIKPDETSGADFPDWLLAQDRIVIRDATVTWHDELRQAPPLALSHLNFDLRNRGRRHLFGLTAEPPRELAARLDIRGDFRGDDLESLGTGKGQVYAELDYADLSGWHAWVDYPIELPHGDGGLRLWLDFDRQALTGATADVRLGRTIARLAPDLPMLDLERVTGRLAVRRADDGFVVQTRRLALATRDGIRIEPTDLDLRWQPGGEARPARGEASANLLDLGALAALAAYLPFDAPVREKIAAWGPQGRARDLQAAWTGEAGALDTYRFKARFDNLSLNAQGVVPGFFGLDGTVEANERGGELKLVTRAATLELPAVFEQSSLVLATLEASADWTVRDGAVEVRLQKASFQNADAVGEASGRYRGDGHGPGEIDLSAKLTRADGGAVWRYMPLVVNQNVRNWLQNSIGGGEATATLRLKGDLKRFPFNDGSGIFEVKGPFQGATLRYAEGWPAFENVTGDLLFAGSRMVIRAQRATLWGVQLADVKAEIADLSVHMPTLVVTGGAGGPTADFLRFIDGSPVGGYIDRVTEGMKAGGGGELRLRLDLPLHDIAATRVDGRYRFLANQLVYGADLPPVSDINGELHFTEKGLEGRKIRGAMFGAPLTVDVFTEDGRVALQANGSISAAALRQQYAHPALEHLTGTTPWSGLIRVRKRTAELRIESSLLGISSSLPDPFNKTAGDALPLVFQRKALPEPSLPISRRAGPGAPAGERDQLEVSLGDTLRVRLLTRREERGDVVEQGLIAIGAPEAGLPERGIRLAVKAPLVDLDFWRRLANGRGGALPVTQFDLRTDELRVFRRPIHALQLAGRQEGASWKMDLKSSEAAGRLEWTRGERDDRLTARLVRLDIPETRGGAAGEPTGEATNGTERLPDIDVAVDQFLMHGREMGQLQLKAQNEAGVWNAQFHIRNEDGDLDGSGRWQEPQGTAAAATALDFKLTTNNVENMLDRLGYPNAIRRGRATLAGQLAWNGAPTRIDYPSLGGKLSLEAARGQFKKLEPGVGRLLGVLSLQSLPRRISLDFRDIFSEGFAFESIEGKLSVAGGVMETSEFEINGPAAKVLMNGSVNLVRETQDLKVRVQPAIGETVATGALLVNPVVGATAWLMNRMFGNPLDKAFAFDYSVTGSWADPKVEKVAAQGPRAALNIEGAMTP